MINNITLVGCDENTFLFVKDLLRYSNNYNIIVNPSQQNYYENVFDIPGINNLIIYDYYISTCINGYNDKLDYIFHNKVDVNLTTKDVIYNLLHRLKLNDFITLIDDFYNYIESRDIFCKDYISIADMMYISAFNSCDKYQWINSIRCQILNIDNIVHLLSNDKFIINYLDKNRTIITGSSSISNIILLGEVNGDICENIYSIIDNSDCLIFGQNDFWKSSYVTFNLPGVSDIINQSDCIKLYITNDQYYNITNKGIMQLLVSKGLNINDITFISDSDGSSYMKIPSQNTHFYKFDPCNMSTIINNYINL